MYYALVGIISLVLLLILNYDVLFDPGYRAKKPEALNAYRFFLISLSVFFIADTCWGIFNENQLPVASYVATTFFFLTVAVIVFAWSRFVIKYVGDVKELFSKIANIIGFLFLGIGVGLVVINFFVPILFTYEGAAYTAKLGRFVFFTAQLVLYAAYSVYSMVRAFKNKGFKRGRYIAISAFGLWMATAIVFQVFYPNYPFYAVGCIFGAAMLHAFVVTFEKNLTQDELRAANKREQQRNLEIHATRELAYIDPLTHKKNKHSYVEFESNLDELIREGKVDEFALFVFDLNDLKLINDTYGHEMGDQYIIKSCEMIDSCFPNTDLYRFGGDEFVMVVQGKSYETRYDCLNKFNKMIEANISTKEPIIAVGFSDFVKEKDNTLRAVFLRADERMYTHKRRLKQMGEEQGSGSEETNVIKTKINTNLRLEMYEMFYHNPNLSLIDMLNGSNADEIVEVDLVNDTFKQYYHVEGKYFVPNVEISYRELLEFTTKYIVHPDDVGDYEALMKYEGFFERLATAKIPNFDFAHFRYKLQDGSYRYVEQVIITGEENGIPEGMFRMYVFDINNLKNRQLGKISSSVQVVASGRDPMTGLLTSKDYFKEAEQIVTSKPDVKWCMVSLDIEHFKFFDDWFGRDKGDYLLSKIGGGLRKVEEKYGGVAGYFGQDDFTVLMPYDMKNIESIYDELKEYISSFGLTAGFLPAIGIAIIEKDMVLVDAFDRATIAQTKAKDNMRYRICLYASEYQFLAEQEYKVLTEFMKAIKNDEVTFYLQPQCHIVTKQIVGAEALARWIKSDGTVIPPGKFVPILEKYGFITDLDKYIWEKVCSWLATWLKTGHKAVPISVNVSQIDIFNLDIAKYFHNLSEMYGIPHNLLKIEITESAYAETTTLIDELVKKLRDDGFVVLMDDFGSGYSSLNMLSNIKLDAIKLDGNFLSASQNEADQGMHIVESIINMTKMMGLPVIVEGVETKQQSDFLNELGCIYAQGYYYYKPMPIEDFERLTGDGSIIDSLGFVVHANEQFRVREFLDESLYSDSMLNNILGAVAIYSWTGKHVDIVRYNQQFYESVSVPEFTERLTNIEQFLPKDDQPKLFAALKEAMSNRLTGATADLRFFKTDGSLTYYRIRFYHLGKKEGGERFYGSAINVTELVMLKEEKKLIASQTLDDTIFVRRQFDKLHYSVASHGLADLIGETPEELEEELNSGAFMKRIIKVNVLNEFIKKVRSSSAEAKSFSQTLEVLNNKNEKVVIELLFNKLSSDKTSIDYVLRTRKIEYDKTIYR